MPEIFRLRLYGDDGVTVAAEFSTDAADDKPHLCEPTSFAAQEISLAEGRAKIGSCSVDVIDVPTVPGDQDTGYLTSLLPDADGRTARIGRRAHLEIKVDGVFENVINGVVDDVELGDSFSHFRLSIKDQREVERRIRAFTTAKTSSIVPRGVIDGFGRNAAGEIVLADPVTPLQAKYNELAIDVVGFTHVLSNFQFIAPVSKDKDGRFRPPVNQVVSDVAREQLEALGDRGDNFSSHLRVRILWRPAGSSDAYTAIEQPHQWFFANAPFTILGGVVIESEGATDVNWINNFNCQKDDQVYPANGQLIEVILGYMGPPTEDYPLHYEGPAGELLKGMLDGDYSDAETPPLASYDEDAVLALDDPIIARITEPLDDEDGIWRWVETNIYAVTRSVPALDDQGRISPVRYTLPDPDEELIQLDDTNCVASPGWSHTGSDAINVVEVTYQRLYKVPDQSDPTGMRAKGDGLSTREITVKHEHVDSIAILGEHPLTLKPATLCAIGGLEGEAISGDVANEAGAQLAAQITREATDRFLLGGQHFVVNAMRSDVGRVRPGQWAIGACSWWPEYSTGLRGANRLAQVVRVRLLDSQWYELELIDAGPENVPLGQPTLDPDSAVVNADGSVSFNVTSIPAGISARIDYAFSDTEPAVNSPLWQFAARIEAPSSVTIVPTPAGGRIWIRGRGESPGRRPSAYTLPFSVDITEVPRVRNARISLDRKGVPTVRYIPNDFCDGVRIAYSIHLARVIPAYADFFDFAATGSNVLSALKVRPGEVLDVRIDAYPGFDGAAVTGTKGTSQYARTARSPDNSSNALSRFGKRKQNKTSVTVGGIPGALVDLVFVYVKTYDIPDSTEETEVPELVPEDVPVATLDPAVNLDSNGFLTYTVERPDVKHERYIWFVPVDADGEEGRIEMMRVDAKFAEAPYFDHWKQTNPDLLLTDVYGRVNDPGGEGGTLSVWSEGSDFTGSPDGTLDIDKDDMPFSFGPGTTFSSGQLLNDLPVPPGETGHIALQFDTTDGRTTGQVLVTLEDSLSTLVDEFGALRVDSWRNALKLASSTEGVGVGEVLPPDGDTYTEWYKPSENKLYKWNVGTAAWEVDEGTGRIAFGTAVGGFMIVGAINAQAIQAGAVNAKLVGAYRLIADNLDIGALSLIADDLGAIVHGVMHNDDNSAGLDLDATGSDPFLYHSSLQLLADGSAIFSGALSAASGTFAGDLTAVTAHLYGAMHIRQSIAFDADDYGLPDAVLGYVYATGKNTKPILILTSEPGPDGSLLDGDRAQLQLESGYTEEGIHSPAMVSAVSWLHARSNLSIAAGGVDLDGNPFPLKVGANGTGPSGSGRMIYLDAI